MSLVVKKKAKEAIESISEEKARVALDFINYLRERGMGGYCGASF